jgi:hypothetical protein
MPFVPLASRKPLPVILDDDKARMTLQQRERDDAVVTASSGRAPGRSGYRFANHPATLGGSSQRSAPFQGGTSTWRPPEVDPGGPASRREAQSADYGGLHEGSHSMRRPKSLPTLKQEGAQEHLMECHPVATELRRLDKLATLTEKTEMKQPLERRQPAAAPPTQPRSFHTQGGLVQFPKYMLIHNCHLKTMDVMRYHQEQEKLAKEQEELAKAQEDLAKSQAALGPQSPQGSLGEQSPKSRSAPPISWGAPVLGDAAPGEVAAGSAMPLVRGAKTSNWFR